MAGRGLLLGAVLLTLGCAGKLAEPAQANGQAVLLVPSGTAPSASATPAPAPAATPLATADEKCSGVASDALVQALSGRAAQVRFCYESLLKTSPQAQGRLLIEVRVSPEGQVLGTRALEDDIHEPELTSCALGKLSSTALPAPQGGCVKVNVPLRFLPQKPPATEQAAPSEPKPDYAR